MPSTAVTVATLYDTYHERLGLHWIAGREGAGRPIGPSDDKRVSLIGHLNFIHPHRIQVLGASELNYLIGLGKNSYQDALQRLFSPTVAAVIVAEAQEPLPALKRQAKAAQIPLLGSRLDSARLIDHINYYLTELLAEKTVVHGVFMDVMGIGVLLTGASAVGKSELALDLISRGHRLIADDAPEFTRVAPDTLRGTCPEPLRDFMEVRGLGVLNVRAMFGDSAVMKAKNLHLIVDLVALDESALNSLDRLEGSRRNRSLLEVEIPEIKLPVAPGRNLAVLVETAVRNQILIYNGYRAAEAFSERQRHIMERAGR